MEKYIDRWMEVDRTERRLDQQEERKIREKQREADGGQVDGRSGGFSCSEGQRPPALGPWVSSLGEDAVTLPESLGMVRQAPESGAQRVGATRGFLKSPAERHWSQSLGPLRPRQEG